MGLFSWLGDTIFGSNKKEQKQVNDQINRQYQFDRDKFGYLQNLNEQLLPGAQQKANDSYNTAASAYKKILGADNTDSPSYRGYSEYSRTGGVSPKDRGQIEDIIGGYRNFAANRGGVALPDAESTNRYRGGGVYDEFARTGGYSDSDVNSYRARVGSTLPSIYDSLRGELERTNRIQSGINPGFTSQLSRLTRERAREASAANNEAEIALQEAIRGGRRWGAEGMTSSEGALQGEISERLRQQAANFLAGNQGAANAAFGLQDRVNAGRQFGISGLDSSDARGRSEQLAAAQGMAQLYGMSPGEIQALLDNMQQAIGGDVSSGYQNLNIKAGYNQPQSGWDRFTQLAGAAVPFIANRNPRNTGISGGRYGEVAF